ncbi:MAG TPA: glycosyltransferase [Puia sp.]|nr:glycosyltransferase [Puia sp.]
MRILIVGSNKPWAIERFYIKYLTELDADIHLYPAPDIIFDNHSKNIFNKILFKTKIRTGYGKVNKELIREADNVHPDLIWVFKGMEIYPATLKLLGKKFRLVNYNPDHPYVIVSSGGGNKNVRDSVGLYHLHFCYNQNLLKQIEQEFKIPVVSLPFGYDLSEEDYKAISHESELNRVCFLGNPDKTREEVVKFVADNGYPVDVYGHGWNKTALRSHKNVTVHDAVYGFAFWKKMRAYRVQLNIFRQHNIGSHNMRTFEIPGAGAIQLAPYSEEHAFFFNENREIFLYRDQPELLKNVKFLINGSPETVDEIRKAARSRSLDSKYSYKDRAWIVFRTFQDMLVNDK